MGIEEVVDTLGLFPAAGEIKDERPGLTLRQIRHPSGPYVIWYVLNERTPTSDIWLVRLFHERQLRPAPRVTRWTYE